jgi:hypothetical protein
MSGIEAAAVFGRSVHVAGSDRAALGRAIAEFDDDSLAWHEVKPRLEDVFIFAVPGKGVVMNGFPLGGSSPCCTRNGSRFDAIQ